VTNRDSSERKKTTAASRSLGCAARPPSSGCLPRMKAWICGSAMARRLPGVSVRPGSSALKRMPRGA
jgi:hypothetical protein